MMIDANWGRRIDTSGTSWVVGDDRVLRFEEIDSEDPEEADTLMSAFMAHTRRTIAETSLGNVLQAHHAIQSILRSARVRAAISDPSGDFLTEAAEVLGETHGRDKTRAELSHLRRFYIFSADAGFAGFDEDAATIMESVSIGGRPRGVAVRRNDRRSGPLSRREAVALERALWQAKEDGTLPPPDHAPALLLLLLGPNAEALRQMDERDLTDEADATGERILRVPRVKKGHGLKRMDFRDRPIVPALVGMLEALIAHNAKTHPPGDDADPAMGRPMFRRCNPSPEKRRMSNDWFIDRLERTAKVLNLVDDGGGPLHLFPRRLRYTFAKRQVELGTKPDVLMDLLDHCSTDLLLVYFDARLDIVKRLDRALGPRLSVFAAVAMGLAFAPPPRPDPMRGLDEAGSKCLACRRFVPGDAGAIRAQAAELAEQLGDLEARIGPNAREEGAITLLKQRIANAGQAIATIETRDGAAW